MRMTVQEAKTLRKVNVSHYNQKLELSECTSNMIFFPSEMKLNNTIDAAAWLQFHTK